MHPFKKDHPRALFKTAVHNAANQRRHTRRKTHPKPIEMVKHRMNHSKRETTTLRQSLYDEKMTNQLLQETHKELKHAIELCSQLLEIAHQELKEAKIECSHDKEALLSKIKGLEEVLIYKKITVF